MVEPSAKTFESPKGRFLGAIMNTVDLAVQQPEQVSSGPSTWRDWLGIVASVGCAIHCAAMPFVIAYLPALGLRFLADEAFHQWMALICFLIAVAAFVPGIRKHGNWLPVAIGAVGLAFISFAAFGLAGECCPSCEVASATQVGLPTNTEIVEPGCDSCEQCQSCSDDKSIAPNPATPKEGLLSTLAPWLTPFGGLLLVSAHLLNRRSGCLCGRC